MEKPLALLQPIVCPNCGAATPEQSLARIRNQVFDQCAALVRGWTNYPLYQEELIAAITATKEPE